MQAHASISVSVFLLIFCMNLLAKSFLSKFLKRKSQRTKILNLKVTNTIQFINLQYYTGSPKKCINYGTTGYNQASIIPIRHYILALK